MEIDERKLEKVTLYNNKVFASCVEYFKRFPENEHFFAEELNKLAWRCKFIGQFRNHISLTAIPLATKIYEQLGIITFPFIQRVAGRGWDTSGGTWAWAMNTAIDSIGSTDPVRYLLKKNITLFELDSGEIGGQVDKP